MQIDVFHVAWGDQDQQGVLLRLSDGERTAWGEAVVTTAPTDTPEWAGGVYSLLSTVLGPRLLTPWKKPAEVHTRLANIAGNSAARAAIDMALRAWEGAGETPTAATSITSPASLPAPIAEAVFLPVQPSLEELIERVAPLAEQKRAIVLEVCPQWELPAVRSVRAACPFISLAIDCRGSLPMPEMDLLYRLEDFLLDFIEQPFAADDLVAHAMVQQHLRTPVCLHEGASSLARVDQAIDLHSARAIRVDLQRLGGWTSALPVVAAAKAANLTWGLAIPRGIGLAAAEAREFARDQQATMSSVVMSSVVMPANGGLETAGAVTASSNTTGSELSHDPDLVQRLGLRVLAQTRVAELT